MANGGSNIDDIGRQLQELVDSIDFTMPGMDQSLGRDLAGIVANGIQERTVDQRLTPDRTPLDPNKERYRKWKRKRYLVDQPLVRTGQMLSLESLLGDTSVAADTVEMKYGTGEPPSRASTGVALSKSDQDITDIEKAYCNADTRPFYGLDDVIAEACSVAAGLVIKDHWANM